jgi:hypothetical protein
VKYAEASGATLSDPLLKGFAPGPHWWHPHIGSCSRARHDRSATPLLLGHIKHRFKWHYLAISESKTAMESLQMSKLFIFILFQLLITLGITN